MRRGTGAAVAALFIFLACGPAEEDPTFGYGGGTGIGQAGSGGGGGGARFDLSVQGAGYTSHVGEDLHAALVDVELARVVARLQPATKVADGGAFSFSWPGVLEPGRLYYLDFFADHDDEHNGKCDLPSLPPGRHDHAWRERVARVTGNVTLNLQHSQNFEDLACKSFEADPGPFDLVLTGAGYDSHPGEDLHARLVDLDTDEVVAALEPPTRVGQDATIEITMKGVLERDRSYKLAYFADHDNPRQKGDGVCSPDPLKDHAWTVLIPTVRDHVVLVENHTSNFDHDGCRYFE